MKVAVTVECLSRRDAAYVLELLRSANYGAIIRVWDAYTTVEVKGAIRDEYVTVLA